MADTYINGPGAGKSQVQQFHDFLMSEAGNLPYSAQWVLQIDHLPPAISKNLSTVGQTTNLELGSWEVADRAGALKKIVNDGVFIDKGVCIFAQGVVTPPENIGTTVVGVANGFGGLLGAPVITGRNELQALTISFLETNYSFIDFVLRPWAIYTAHYGLVARQANDPRNIKTTLQVFYYDRGVPGKSPGMRKVFRFYNAAPTRVEGILTAWDLHEARQVYSSWTYTHYDVATERLTTAPILAGKTIQDVKIPGKEKFGDFADKKSIPTFQKQPISVGSESLSNPTGFKTNDSFSPNGGAVIGGSYASSLPPASTLTFGGPGKG